MGYDATIHIYKDKHNAKSIEDLIIMLGYEKINNHYYCGSDSDYKYHSGIHIYKKNELIDNKYTFYLRMNAWANGFDIIKANDTLKALKKYCSAEFVTDNGKNRYFCTPEDSELLFGAESGCYLAVERFNNGFQYLIILLNECEQESKFPKEATKLFGVPSPEIMNANIYLTYLCSLVENYFRDTYIALLRFSERKKSVFNNKITVDNLLDVSNGNSTIEEVYARTLSFQNIQKIVQNFKSLDKRLDIGSVLKKPYHKRKQNLYDKMNEIFERRHAMVHHVQIDIEYSLDNFKKDSNDIVEIIKRVYQYLCECNDWVVQNIIYK